MAISTSVRRRLRCLICSNESFVRSQDLDAHIERVHEALDDHFCYGTRPFYFQTCAVCYPTGHPRHFTSIMDVMVHIQTAHPQEVTTARAKFRDYIREAREE